MHSNTSHQNKENQHPNRSRVQEISMDSVCKQYVLEGERLKVKSILYQDRQQPQAGKVAKVQKKQHKVDQEIDEQQYAKLIYLDELGVLDEEEKTMLKKMKEIKQRHGIPPIKQKKQPLQVIKNEKQLLQPNLNYPFDPYQQQFEHHNNSHQQPSYPQLDHPNHFQPPQNYPQQNFPQFQHNHPPQPNYSQHAQSYQNPQYHQPQQYPQHPQQYKQYPQYPQYPQQRMQQFEYEHEQ